MLVHRTLWGGGERSVEEVRVGPNSGVKPIGCLNFTTLWNKTSSALRGLRAYILSTKRNPFLSVSNCMIKKLVCPLLLFICTLVHLSQSWQGKIYRSVLLLLLFVCLFLFFPDLAFEWLRETWGGQLLHSCFSAWSYVDLWLVTFYWLYFTKENFKRLTKKLGFRKANTKMKG